MADPRLVALSADERAMLDLERVIWRHQGVKETAVRELFGWTLTGYLQRLNALITRPAALAYSPVVVRRLQRLAVTRRARVSGGH